VSTELWLLFWSVVVYGLYLGAQSLIFRWRFGVEFAASARDATPASEGELLGRAERALKNFLETYPAFIVLAIVAHFAHPGSAVVFWGMVVWFAARIVYLPLYLLGTFMVRSLVWCVSAIGLGLMFFGVLF
jgi:uncharacterized MAPEG superfamily protein